MNSVIDVYNTAAVTNNNLSPGYLANDLEGLASALLSLQGYALVLSRQPGLIAPADEFDLANQAVTIQTKFRQHSNFVLNRLSPETIKVVTDAEAAANLMSALKSTLSQATLSTATLSTLLLSLESSIEDYTTDARELAERSEREFNRVNEAEKTLDEAITEVIAQLEQPSGELSEVREAINAKKEEIEINITAIVQSGSDVGENVKTLVTGILTSFVPSEADPQAKADSDAEETSDSPDQLTGLSGIVDQTQADDGTETFSVESIGAIESDSSKGKANVSQLIQNNHELADLYQKLARLNGLLAAAKAIRDQIHDYSKALQKFSVQAEHTENSWSQIQMGFKKMGQTLRQASEEDPDIKPLATVAIATRHWQRVSDRIETITSALAGLESGFSNLDNPEPEFS